MSAPVSAKCPHCRVDIKVERPHEPRSAPCPSCNGTIVIPDNLYPRGWMPKRSQATSRPVHLHTAQDVGSANVMRQMSTTFLVICGVILMASGTLFGGLIGSLRRSVELHPVTSIVVPAPTTSRLPASEIRSRIDGLNDRRNALRAEIARVQSDLDNTDATIRKILDMSQTDLDTVAGTLKDAPQ